MITINHWRLITNMLENNNVVYLTKEGYEELENRLKYLKSEGIVDIANKLDVARSYGDISENSEYDAAREEEAQLHMEIMKIENQLRNAKIIAKSRGDVVTVGSTVVVEDEYGDQDTYKITGSFEADPTKNLISNESPIGKALVGASKGDTVGVKTATSSFELKIISVK